MQIHGSTHRTVIECARTVYLSEGLIAFYISYPTTLTMTIPFQAVQFSSYEYFRKVLNPRGDYDPKTHMIAGGLAGAIAAAATTPLDVAKTLLQTRGTSNDVRVRNCNGLFDAFRIIYENDGHLGQRCLTWMKEKYVRAVIGIKVSEGRPAIREPGTGYFYKTMGMLISYYSMIPN